MPLAPFPSIPSSGALPVIDEADVLAAYPAEQRAPETAPVRDAIVAAQTALFLEWQNRAAYAAAQSDPSRATERYLEGLAEERGVIPQEGESSSALRTRLFSVPAVVTPDAIRAAVDAILGEFTDITCHVWETVLDRWFVHDGDPAHPWHSFVSDGAVDDVGPSYPDRYYDARGGSDPGGSFAFDNHNGRAFVIRLPDLGGVTDYLGFAFDGTQPLTIQNRPGFYVFDGSQAVENVFVFDGGSEPLAIYQRIVNVVVGIVGHGVRFSIHVDTKL